MSLLLRRASAARAAWRVHSGGVAQRAAVAAVQPGGAASWRQGLKASVAFEPFAMRHQWRSATTDAAPAAAERVAESDAAKEAIVEQLRPLCSSLYMENRAAVTADELLAQWEAHISTILKNDAVGAHPLLANEVARTYEQGVAIALKQREFDLANALVAQMKTLGLKVPEKIYVYQIRAAALPWISPANPLTLDDFRALDLGTNWEKFVLELVRSERRPHYHKPEIERRIVQTRISRSVSSILTKYLNDVPADEQRIEPFNAAIQAYASNGFSFAKLLRVLNRIPKDSKARASLNVDTFLALLEGARWNDIPLTIERLTKSQVLRTRDADVGPLFWDRAMRAIINSYSERFFDKRTPIEKNRLRDLQNIFLDVESQLQSEFPMKPLRSVEEHNAIYEIRIKTAAVLSLPRQVHSLLNEYKTLAPVEYASGQLGTSVFFKALEAFPPVAAKRITEFDIRRVEKHPDVKAVPSVAEIVRAIEELESNVIPAKKAETEKTFAARAVASDEALIEAYRVANRELRKAHQTVIKLKKRLAHETADVAEVVAHQRRLQAADRAINIVLEHLRGSANGKDLKTDLDLALAIMNQYMTAGNRFSTRINRSRRELVSDELMTRVFKLLDTVVCKRRVDVSDEEDLAKIKQLFSLATKTATLFWAEQDLERLLRLQKTVLGTDRLDAEDYDHLVFLRVAKHDIGRAYELLQEMHYAGTSPTPTTIHRIVTGVLHKLNQGGNKKKEAAPHTDGDDVDGEEDDEDFNAGADDEDEVMSSSWSNGPSRLEDIPSFIQEWYNLYRVKPQAKTVVPVFARLLATNNVWEVKRLLQILDSMDGGLTPMTEFWLEKRLESVGKTVDDLRAKR